MRGRGYWLFIVILFKALKSTHMSHVPSFFGSKTKGDPQVDVLGLMTPLSRISWICFLISQFSKTDTLCMPMFGSGASYYNWISCWIPLLGGNPFGSWNISSYWLIASYKSDFNCASQPWKSCFSTLYLGLIIKSTKFFLALTNLFICPTFTSDKFNFFVCALTMYSTPFLNNWYLFSWRWKMALLSYKYGLPNTKPQISNGITSSSTSSIKFAVMENLILHLLVTCNLALSHIQPRG